MYTPTDLLANGDDPVEDIDTTGCLVLRGIELHWAQLLTEEGWHGLAYELSADTGQDFRRHAFYVSVRTMMLGLTDERHVIKWPRDWKQHLKQAVINRMSRKDVVWWWRLRRWLRWWLGPVLHEQEEVQVYKSACPHINAGGNHNPRMCIDYLSRMDQRGYLESDYLVSKAHAILSCALEPVMSPGQPFDAFAMTQGLDSAARKVLELLREAMDATGDTPTDGPCTYPHCDNGHGCCCCKE